MCTHRLLGRVLAGKKVDLTLANLHAVGDGVLGGRETVNGSGLEAELRGVKWTLHVAVLHPPLGERGGLVGARVVESPHTPVLVPKQGDVVLGARQVAGDGDAFTFGDVVERCDSDPGGHQDSSIVWVSDSGLWERSCRGGVLIGVCHRR